MKNASAVWLGHLIFTFSNLVFIFYFSSSKDVRAERKKVIKLNYALMA
jgi:hypothetical protein